MNGRQATAAAAGTVDIGGGLTVNRLGFGAMRITGPGIWGDPPDPGRARAALRRAVALDVTFIDTADSYGPEVSERLIADTLFPYPDELVIATKGGLVRPGPGRWVPDGRPEHLRQACKGSLARLRLDRIDLYQFHRPDPKVPIAESIGALAELKDEGKIRHVGVSNFSEQQLREAERATPWFRCRTATTRPTGRRSRWWTCASRGCWCSCRGRRSRRLRPAARSSMPPSGTARARTRSCWPGCWPGHRRSCRSQARAPEHVEQNIAAAGIELSPDEITAISKAA
jgi:aryl-alcohol dehydrogenase-like predicted oxidoreductase